MEPAKFDQLLATLQTLAVALSTPRQMVPVDRQLWDSTSCATYFNVSASHFMQRMAPLPDFPRPINIASGSSRTARWKAGEIMAWADARQERSRQSKRATTSAISGA